MTDDLISRAAVLALVSLGKTVTQLEREIRAIPALSSNHVDTSPPADPVANAARVLLAALVGPDEYMRQHAISSGVRFSAMEPFLRAIAGDDK